MKNDIIYLATVTKSRDYDNDLLLAREAFSTYDKAVAFLESEGLINKAYEKWDEWVGMNDLDISGDIAEQEIK